MSASLSISITQNSQSTANNTSSVTVTVKCVASGTTHNGYSQSGWVKIDGTKYTFSHSFAQNATTTLYTKTVTISHNSDGTKTLSVSASYDTGVSTGTITKSASKTLTTIARASVPTLDYTSRTMGNPIKITTNRKSTSFYHTIKWEFGGKTGTIGTAKGVTTSVTFTPAVNTFAPYLKTAMSATCKIICETYTSSTASTPIGTKTVSFTLKIPTYNLDPTMGINVGSDSNILQNLTRVNVTPNQPTYYGLDATFKVTLDELSATATGASSAELGVPTKSGQRILNVTVSDTRGNSATSSTQVVNITPYELPKLTTLQAVRCSNAAGTVEDEEGQYLRVDYAGSMSTLSGNRSTINLKLEEASGRVVATAAPTTSASNFSGSIVTTSADADMPTKKYVLTGQVSDNYTTTTPVVRNITIATPIIDFGASGHELAFFGLANPDATSDMIFANAGIRFRNKTGIYGTTTDGEQFINFQPCSSNDNCVIGYGLYEAQRGRTNLYGNSVKFYVNDEITSDRHLKELWSGALYMNADQQITLSEKVSDQLNGIVVAFSLYDPATAKASDSNVHTFFIPKEEVVAFSGKSMHFLLITGGTIYKKTLLPTSTYITGYADNNNSAFSLHGKTVDNRKFVLRKVWGV